MRNRIKFSLVCVGCFVLILAGFDGWSQSAQQPQITLRHNWYFGSSTNGIRFNKVSNIPTTVTNKAVPFGTGGSAVASDKGNANLFFYTDGSVIYDYTHKQMPGGTGLNANTSANQPVAICPVPGQVNKFFVFTNTANFTAGGTISYSVVDMNLFGTAAFPSPPFGDVESKNTALPGLVSRAEGMITVPHANGNDFWLITQQVNSLFVSATLITAASYTGTFSTITSSVAPYPTTIAHFGYHTGLRKIAAAPQDPSTDAIILNFNNTTGAINFDRIILNSGRLTTTNQSIYDIEWSPSGQYLYISRHGEAGLQADLLQYDYQNSATTLAPVLPSPVFRSYGLQLAPDGKIYHLYQTAAAGSFLLGRIDRPDSVATAAAYNPAPFGNLNYGGTQFPGFLPRDTTKLNIDFSFVGTCQNSPTTFFPVVKPGADSLVWDLGDGNSANAWSPIHTYAKSGAFTVKLRAFYQNQIDSVSKAVNITAFPLTLQMTQDTTACRQEFPAPRGSASPTQFKVTVKIQGGTPSSIAWSNGDLGATLTPDSAGYYYVVVTDATGCSAYAGVNVKEYGLQTQIYNKWYFGNKAGIDFTPSPPKALSESAMNAPEGCTIICDRNGQQIFYTDGNTVYDKTHAAIASNIGGNTASTQSSLIVAVPGDETLYYIFTTQAINGTDSLKVKYSFYDLKKNNGKGQVVKTGVFLYMKSTEQLTAFNNQLILHEYGNNIFRVYPIGPDGIGNPKYSAIGGDHSLAILANGEGYMKLGARGNLAVPMSNPGTSNHIELFQLDTAGLVSNFRDIDLKEPNGQIYGVEFSPGGRKLFATVRYTGGSSAIYEYSIDSLEKPHFKQRIAVAADAGAIQTGPDGQLYVAINDGGHNTSLGTIAATDDTTRVSNFTLNGFTLAAGTNSRLGLPNLVQNNSTNVGGPSIDIVGLCAGDSTHFNGTPTDQIDNFNWRVYKNGAFINQSNQATFALLLPGAGNYTVTMQLTNRCSLDTTLTKNFVITTPPVNPTKGIAICSTQTVTLDANPSNAVGYTFDWSTTETTRTIQVNREGLYNVDITDALGCKTTGQFLTADQRPDFDLGPDLTICEDNNTPALNVQNPGMQYQWTINGTNASTTSTQAVDVTNPGTFVYSVTVREPTFGCVRTDSKTYTINVSPNFTMAGTNPASCGAKNGSITLQISPSTPLGGPLYSYFISGPGGASQNGVDQSAPSLVTLPNVGAGTFSGVVTDQVSGCTISQAFSLTDATYTATAAPFPNNCDPVTLRITTVGPVNFPVTYLTTNSATGATTTGSGAANPFTTTTGLAAGNYVIQVTDNTGCIYGFNQTITPAAAPTITLTPDLCNNTLTASGATAGTYQWTATPPSGLSGVTAGQATVNLTANAGNVTYTVIGNNGACNGTQTITLNVGSVPNPVITQSNECATTVTLSVNPNGPFTYRWFRNGGPDNTLGGNPVTLGLSDNGQAFMVQLYEPQSGCTRDSPTIQAKVTGPVDASLSSTPPCQDDQPFTLTATTTATGVTYAWARNGTTIAGVTTATTNQTQEGTYKIDITKSACKASASLTIVRAALPQGNLPNRLIICDDPENLDPTTSSVDLDPGVFAKYEWSKNKLLLNYTKQVLNADSKGIYEVKLTNSDQCTNIDETEIINECSPRINAPNVFKPGSKIFNGFQTDLTNADFWVLTKFIEEDRFQIFIFNRWGEMVFSSTDRAFKWNGGYNNNAGQPLPPGTYSYVIKYVSTFRPDKGVQEKRGGVALIR